MGEDGGPNPQAEDCRRNQHADDAEADIEILPYDPAGLPAQSNCKWKVRQIIGRMDGPQLLSVTGSIRQLML